MTRAMTLATLLAALAGCVPANPAGTNFAEVCADQAAMATAGRTDGRPQTITCPG
jgi:hypothetical protein